MIKNIDLHKISILTPVKDAEHFLGHYFRQLIALDYPHDRLSIGLLESDSSDRTWEWLNINLPNISTYFCRVNIYKRDFNFKLTTPRWEASIQVERRSILAKSRNYLLSKCLNDEEWVLWLDIDICDYPTDIIQQLLAVNKSIVTPECVLQHTDRS
jgi:cellulose synthase/poly-beta-1,6-N-acetylglucosamine synthase-like glycosyltransferase